MDEPLIDRLNQIVRLLFLAGLAMHSVQDRLESDFGRARAALAVAALDEAIDDLRELEDSLTG